MAIDKVIPVRLGHLPMRQQRIDRWIHKGRSWSNNRQVICSSTASTGKRSESAFSQADRQLRMSLLQLGAEREKLIERFNFDQKLFANKQVLRHKDNPTVVNTLNYVRKCCKYSELYGHEEQLIDPSLIFDQSRSHSSRERFSRSRKSSRDLTSKKPLISEDPKYQVPFHPHPKRASQSAHVNSKTRPSNRTAVSSLKLSLNHTRSINSAPPVSLVCHREKTMKTSAKSQRPSSRIFCTKKSLEDFRRHPEQFLSQSNRYLPLLRQQAMEIQAREFQRKLTLPVSRLSEGSDLAVEDEAKSFLSEDIEIGKSAGISHIPGWNNNDKRRKSIKPLLSSKLDLTEKGQDDTSEYTAIVSRLRDHEYAHMQTLIHSNSMEHILEPLTTEKKREKTITLTDLLRSNDSLRHSATSVKPNQNKLNIERNLSKLGVLIF